MNSFMRILSILPQVVMNKCNVLDFDFCSSLHTQYSLSTQLGEPLLFFALFLSLPPLSEAAGASDVPCCVQLQLALAHLARLW